MNPKSTLDVFGNDAENLKTGLNAMLGMLTGGNSGLSAEMTRYMLSIMVLERRLNKNQEAMNQLGQRIEQFERQADYFEPLSEGVFNALAGIYVDVVSPAGPRIQVTGSPDILKNTLVQAKLEPLCSQVFAAQCFGNKLVEVVSNSCSLAIVWLIRRKIFCLTFKSGVATNGIILTDRCIPD